MRTSCAYTTASDRKMEAIRLHARCSTRPLSVRHVSSTRVPLIRRSSRFKTWRSSTWRTLWGSQWASLQISNSSLDMTAMQSLWCVRHLMSARPSRTSSRSRRKSCWRLLKQAAQISSKISRTEPSIAIWSDRHWRLAYCKSSTRMPTAKLTSNWWRGNSPTCKSFQ